MNRLELRKRQLNKENKLIKKFQWGGSEEEEKLPGIYDRDQEPIISSFYNEFLKDPNFKSGLLPSRTIDRLVFPKKPILDFSQTGLPKDWRQLRSLYTQSMNTAYLPGYPPKISDEILNTAKLEQKEGLGKKMQDRAVSAGGDTRFQVSHYKPAFKYGDSDTDIKYINEGNSMLSRDIMYENNKYYGGIDKNPIIYRYMSVPLAAYKNGIYSRPIGKDFLKHPELDIPLMYGYNPYRLSDENRAEIDRQIKEDVEAGFVDMAGWVGEKNYNYGRRNYITREQDPNYKLLPYLPEVNDYNKSIVEKMKGIPSTFKHAKTPLEELLAEAPSLFSGQFKDKRLPFEGSIEKLKELANKEKLSEQDIEYINTEMLRAASLRESFAVRKNILAGIDTPSFIDALVNRNVEEKDIKPPNWKTSHKEYNEQHGRFSQMVPSIKSDIYNTGFLVQSDFRGDEYGNMAMRVSPNAGDNDLTYELKLDDKDISDISLGISPHYAGAHEYWHNIQSGGIPFGGNYTKISTPEIVNPKLESFLKTYQPEKLDKYWESINEFDADNFQLLYNIAYDPIYRQRSINKPLGTDINVKDIDLYFYDLDSSIKKDKMQRYDPVTERIGRMWSSSTPKQKLEYVKLLNKYYSKGGIINKYQLGGQFLFPSPLKINKLSAPSLLGPHRAWLKRPLPGTNPVHVQIPKKTLETFPTYKPNDIFIKDPRSIRLTTGKPLNPNIDLLRGKYNTNVPAKLLEAAKERSLNSEDAWNLISMEFQETGWGKTDPYVGHTKGYGGSDPYKGMIDAYVDKMKTADRLGYQDPALRLQAYNGYGTIFPHTEVKYHGFKMRKIYGVPVPKEGISMKENPLYGKQILDIKDSIMKRNPEVVKMVESYFPNSVQYKKGGKYITKFQKGNSVSPFISKNGKTYLSNKKLNKFYINEAISPVDYYENWINQRPEVLQKNIDDYNEYVRGNIEQHHGKDLKENDLILSRKEAVNRTFNDLQNAKVITTNLSEGRGFYVPGLNTVGIKPILDDKGKYTKELPIDPLFHEFRHIVDVAPKSEIGKATSFAMDKFVEKLQGRKLPDYMEANRYDYTNWKDVLARLAVLRKNYLTPTGTYSVDDIKNFLQDARKKGISNIQDLENMFSPEEILDMHNSIVQNTNPSSTENNILTAKRGGIIRDNDGYWNPKNWGKPVQIEGNNITMKGVQQPLLGISDTGDIQYMLPGNDYKFRGNNVTEVPMFQLGGLIPKTEEDVKKIAEGKSLTENLKLFSKLYPLLPKALKDKAKEYAYKIGRQSSLSTRTNQDVQDVVNNTNYSGNTNNYIGNLYDINSNRDILKLGIYNDTTGFKKVPKILSDNLRVPLSSKDDIKRYKNIDWYWGDVGNKYSSEKINYNDSISYNDIQKSLKELIIRNRKNKDLKQFEEPYLSYRADSILSSPDNVIYSDNISITPYMFPYQSFDNLAGVSAMYYKDKSGNLRYRLNDVYDFEPERYANRWINSKNYEDVEVQAAAMNKVFKPIGIMMDNPVSKIGQRGYKNDILKNVVPVQYKKDGGEIEKFQEGSTIKPYDNSFKANVNRTIGKVKEAVPKSFWFLPGLSDVDDALAVKQAFSPEGTTTDKAISVAGLSLPFISTKAIKVVIPKVKNMVAKIPDETLEKVKSAGFFKTKIDDILKLRDVKKKFQAKEEGINFVKNWIQHPERQSKINNLASLTDNEVIEDIYHRLYKFNPNVAKDKIDNYIKDRTSLFDIKELKKLFNVKTNNLFSLDNINRGYLVSKQRFAPSTVGISDSKGFYRVAREYSPENIRSTTIHEAAHNLTKNDDNLRMREITNAAFGGKDKVDELINKFAELQPEYYTDPTEVYARIMQLRKHFALKPEQFVNKELGEKIFREGAQGTTPVDMKFFRNMYEGRKGLSGEGGEWFTNLFNRLPGVVPIGVITGIGTVGLMNNKKE